MGVNSLPKTDTRQRRDCDLNPDPSAPESSTLTTRLPSRLLWRLITLDMNNEHYSVRYNLRPFVQFIAVPSFNGRY